MQADPEINPGSGAEFATAMEFRFRELSDQHSRSRQPRGYRPEITAIVGRAMDHVVQAVSSTPPEELR